jgi:hypothetical protein
VPRGAHVVLTTEDSDVAPDGRPISLEFGDGAVEVRFARPGAVMLRGSGFAA